METAVNVLTIASFVVAGAVVVLNGLAATLKSPRFGKAADVLSFIHDKVLVLILPFLANQLAAQKSTDVKETK
jgi:hypothetical protein